MKYIYLLLLTTVSLVAQTPVPNVPPKVQQQTANVSLIFDPSPSIGVTKYVIRRGNISGSYVEMVELPSTQLTYTWPNVDAFKSSFFVVSAKNSAGDESVYSNEVEYKPAIGKLEPPNLKPVSRVTAKFKITPPETIEHVGSDNEVKSKFRIFMDDGNGSQNLMLTTTDGDFRIAEGLKIKSIEINK
jgi:hypothetical protein